MSLPAIVADVSVVRDTTQFWATIVVSRRDFVDSAKVRGKKSIQQTKGSLCHSVILVFCVKTPVPNQQLKNHLAHVDNFVCVQVRRERRESEEIQGLGVRDPEDRPDHQVRHTVRRRCLIRYPTKSLCDNF